MPHTEIVMATGFGTFVGGLLLALWWIFAGDRIRKLPDRVEHLETQRLAHMEKEIQEVKSMIGNHIEDDQTQRVITMLEEQHGQLSKIFTKLETISEDTAKQGANIIGNRESIKRIDNRLEAHLEKHHS